jgi:hypothetical protein
VALAWVAARLHRELERREVRRRDSAGSGAPLP